LQSVHMGIRQAPDLNVMPTSKEKSCLKKTMLFKLLIPLIIGSRVLLWFPCLIVVSEPKSWGIQGYVNIPKDNQGNVSQAYIRLENDQIEKIGVAIVVAA